MGCPALSLAWPVAFSLALAGCGPAAVGPDAGPDAHELSNLDPALMAPASSAANLTRTFVAACLDGPRDYPGAEAGLRKAGFVPLPAGTQDRVTAFVSNDRRPMVLVSRNGRICGVGAASRTGQTAGLRDLVAKRFPEAVPLDTAALHQPGLEQAWQVKGGVIYLQRVASPVKHSRLIFGIWRAAEPQTGPGPAHWKGKP